MGKEAGPHPIAQNIRRVRQKESSEGDIRKVKINSKKSSPVLRK